MVLAASLDSQYIFGALSQEKSPLEKRSKNYLLLRLI
jgi:hypothetical protein